MALSIAREKATSQLDSTLLERFARKAQIPSQLVLQTAQETAARITTLWPKLQKEFPLDRETRRKLTGHMKSVPLLFG
jgi:serine/threonine-protein kinase HipA